MGRTSVFFTTDAFNYSQKVWEVSYLVGLVLYPFSLSSPQVWISATLGTPLLGGRMRTVGPGNNPTPPLPKSMHFLPLPKPSQSQSSPPPPQSGLQRWVNSVGVSLDAH